MLTQEYLKTRLHYNPDTGIFTWVKSNRYGLDGGQAGTLSEGYIRIVIDRINYFAHRLAFLYMTGKIPYKCDHEDRIKNNNKWTNLRSANSYQNGANSSPYKTNTSGYRGVSAYGVNGKWKTQIRHKGKVIYLGSFVCPHQAHTAYMEASKRINGEFSPF